MSSHDLQGEAASTVILDNHVPTSICSLRVHDCTNSVIDTSISLFPKKVQHMY
jgi:hypothetical protein